MGLDILGPRENGLWQGKAHILWPPALEAENGMIGLEIFRENRDQVLGMQ